MNLFVMPSYYVNMFIIIIFTCHHHQRRIQHLLHVVIWVQSVITVLRPDFSLLVYVHNV